MGDVVSKVQEETRVSFLLNVNYFQFAKTNFSTDLS